MGVVNMVMTAEIMSENVELGAISRQLGYSQMEYFLLDQLAKPLLPVAWIGGI
ncbi:hypothetical protein GW864_04345, partial [bacterium]|nr:hypothetical protein [bacterium]